MLRNVSLLVAIGMSFLPLAPLHTLGMNDTAPKGSVVKITGEPGSFQLIRNGQPYFIRGVGGDASKQLLLEMGGNSFRTWGAEQIEAALDEAHKRGMTVTAGIWLGHTGEFDYGDPEAVRKQFEMCEAVVRRFKDHPALLMWAFGNEMEGDGKDLRVYKAIEEIAAMAKRIDPNHPTMTVIAEIGEDKVRNIQKLAPSIDIIGINSYGGAFTLPERYAKQGGKKPYIVTEFGPLGQWEVAKTSWGAPIEATSTEKAELYKKAYEAAISGAKGTCLGSYAFLWGNKQEATMTWFGMLLPDGTPLAAVETMSELWTGKPPKNRAPRIQRLSVSQAENLRPGQTITATLQASDPENGPLRVEWLLKSEAIERLTAGRPERVPPKFPDAVLNPSPTSATVKMPAAGGGYRVFAFVYDNAGLAAVANVPVFVKAD